jgi:hypothetical protein
VKSKKFKEEKTEYLKEKLMSLKPTVRTKVSETLHSVISDFKKGYQPRT